MAPTRGRPGLTGDAGQGNMVEEWDTQREKGQQIVAGWGWQRKHRGVCWRVKRVTGGEQVSSGTSP